MRNVDDNRAAEGPPDDGTGAAYPSAMTRRARRRKQAMIGAAGLLSILGVGGIVATQVLTDSDTAPAARNGALQPVAPSTSAPLAGKAPGSSANPSAAAKGYWTPGAKPVTPTPRPSTTAEQIAAARSAAATATNQVRRPMSPADARVATVQDTEVTTSTVRRGGETLTVKSARQDLTGYAELRLAADEGKKVGNARCTNKIRASAGAPATERPTLLLCWRTSAQRSVFTLAVKVTGRPSQAASVAAIDKAWAKLG